MTETLILNRCQHAMAARENLSSVFPLSFSAHSSSPLVYCEPARLYSADHLTYMFPFSWYGWSAQVADHWIVPILGTGVFGFGMMAT